jgi:hypothetical protein
MTDSSAEFEWTLPNRLRADFLHKEIALWEILPEAADEIERLRSAVMELLDTLAISQRAEAKMSDFDKEVMWAESLTGHEFKCVHVDFAREQRAEIDRMTEWNRLRAEDIITLGQRIGRLEATLKAIADGPIPVGGVIAVQDIARAALQEFPQETAND